MQRVWSADVAHGMAYLYSCNIEHRDLKSLNVLLTHDGRGKVTDFGLSKCDELSSATATMAAGIAGTPAFMVPSRRLRAFFSEITRSRRRPSSWRTTSSTKRATSTPTPSYSGRFGLANTPGPA